jgi:hypothetical protein
MTVFRGQLLTAGPVATRGQKIRGGQGTDTQPPVGRMTQMLTGLLAAAVDVLTDSIGEPTIPQATTMAGTSREVRRRITTFPSSRGASHRPAARRLRRALMPRVYRRRPASG